MPFDEWGITDEERGSIKRNMSVQQRFLLAVVRVSVESLWTGMIALDIFLRSIGSRMSETLGFFGH
jgi:hypothetical protein